MASFDLVTQFDAVPALAEASTTTVDIASPSRPSEPSEYRGRLAESLHQQNSQTPAVGDDKPSSMNSEVVEARPEATSISLSHEETPSASPEAVRLTIQPVTGQEDGGVQQPPWEQNQSEHRVAPQEPIATFQETSSDINESPVIGVGTLFQFLPEAPRRDGNKPIPNETDLPSPPEHLTLFLHETSVGTAIAPDESSTQFPVDEALVPPAGFFQTLAAQEALETELTPQQFQGIGNAANEAGDRIDSGDFAKSFKTNSVTSNEFALLAQQTSENPPHSDSVHSEATHREVSDNSLTQRVEMSLPQPATHMIPPPATAPAETNMGPSLRAAREEGVTPLVIFDSAASDVVNHQSESVSIPNGDASGIVPSDTPPGGPNDTPVVVDAPNRKGDTATSPTAVLSSNPEDPDEQPSEKLGESAAAPDEPNRSVLPIASGKDPMIAVASSVAAEQGGPQSNSPQLHPSGSNSGKIESTVVVDGIGGANESTSVVEGAGESNDSAGVVRGTATMRHETSSVRGLRDSAAPQPQLDQADFVDKVSSVLRVSNGTSRRLQVGLRPPELGPMTVEVALRDGVLTARLEVQTSVAQKAVLESMPLLRDALAQNGTVIDRIDVQLSDYSNEEEAAGFTESHDQQSDEQEAPGQDQRDRDEQSENRETEVPPTQADSHLDQLDIQV